MLAGENAGAHLNDVLVGLGLHPSTTIHYDETRIPEGHAGHEVRAFLTGLGVHPYGVVHNDAATSSNKSSSGSAAPKKFDLAKAITAFNTFVNTLGLVLPPNV